MNYHSECTENDIYLNLMERVGFEKGLSAGRLEMARKMTLDILQIRFGKILTSIIKQIHSTKNLQLLCLLSKQAIIIEDVEEFYIRFSSQLDIKFSDTL